MYKLLKYSEQGTAHLHYAIAMLEFNAQENSLRQAKMGWVTSKCCPHDLIMTRHCCFHTIAATQAGVEHCSYSTKGGTSTMRNQNRGSVSSWPGNGKCLHVVSCHCVYGACQFSLHTVALLLPGIRPSLKPGWVPVFHEVLVNFHMRNAGMLLQRMYHRVP